MAYNKRTWLARLGQGLNKFIFNGGSKVTLDSSPDVVTQEGTPLSAENMNDLEDRIDDAITSLINGSAKFYHNMFTTSSISGNTDTSVTLTLPSDATEVKAVIPYGQNPYSSNATLLIFKQAKTDGTLAIRTNGSTAQQYQIFYWVIYV